MLKNCFFLLLPGSGDAIKRLTDTNDEPKKDVCDTLSPSEQHTERRLSRDIGTQAISIDFIEEKPKRNHEITKHSTSTWTETNEPEVNLLLSPSKFHLVIFMYFCFCVFL